MCRVIVFCLFPSVVSVLDKFVCFVLFCVYVVFCCVALDLLIGMSGCIVLCCVVLCSVVLCLFSVLLCCTCSINWMLCVIILYCFPFVLCSVC